MFAAVLEKNGFLWVFGVGETPADALADAITYDRTIAAQYGVEDPDPALFRVIAKDDSLDERLFRGTAGILFTLLAS